MLKFAVLFVVIRLTMGSSFIVKDHKSLDESSGPRSLGKTVKLIHNVYKMFNSMKPGTSEETKHEEIPYDGLYSHDNPEISAISTGWNDEKEKVKVKDEKNLWPFDRFAKKTDLYFMGKILLKLIVFKKIVKFIALVGLLFFIPILKDDSIDEEEKDSRNLDVYGKFVYVIL